VSRVGVRPVQQDAARIGGMASQSMTVGKPPERGLAVRRAAFNPLFEALVPALLPLALTFALFTRANAEPAIKAEVRADTTGGYARLVFSLAEETEADVKLSNGIVVITFKKPIDIAAVDRLSGRAPAYISAARRDPDGTAVRLALAQKVTV